MGYTLNPEYVSGIAVVVVVSDHEVGWFEWEGGRRRDTQLKYTPDLFSAIHGVRLSSTGGWQWGYVVLWNHTRDHV